LAVENLTTEEKEYNLLFATDIYGRTAWHVAASYGNLDIMQKLWKMARDNLTTEEIKNNLLLATDSYGKQLCSWKQISAI
jgi:ankyrin repeat protein